MPAKSKVTPTPSNAGLLALNATLEEWRTGKQDKQFDWLQTAELPASLPAPALIAATDGIAVEFVLDINDQAEKRIRAIIREKLGLQWELRDDSVKADDSNGSFIFRGLTALPPPGQTPAIGKAWDLARELAKIEGVRSTTPLFAQVAPMRGTVAPAEAVNLAAAEVGLVDEGVGRTWHHKVLNVPTAWQHLRNKGIEPGQGITVAVVDTGYTEHPEVFEQLTKIDEQPNRVRGVDLLDGQDSRDPLEGRPPLAFPSHGTSVASVIVSPEGKADTSLPDSDFIDGIAPAAQVMPIRMTTSVVLLLPNKLISALCAAVQEKVDVINISLGLPYYWPALHAAVRYAVENGVIVVAASGNYWPLVVYPAAFPEVLAAAACGPDLQPWVWSSAGAAVDVLAPGVAVQQAYSVKVESSVSIDHLVGPGTGTTYAAACCSGLAALWLSFHGGRRKLIDHYGEARYVPQAFHYLLRKTAKRFSDRAIDNRYGEGIPQAAALLEADLPGVEELEVYIRDRQLEMAEMHAESAISFHEFNLPEAEGATDIVLFGLQSLLGQEVGGPSSVDLLKELQFHVASRPELFIALRNILTGGRPDFLRKRLLDDDHLSQELRARLEAGQASEHAPVARTPSLLATTSVAAPVADIQAIPRPRPPAPQHRRLRIYAFDPSIGAELRTADYNQIIVNLRWEETQEGPVGEYLEIVDVDPSSRCVYAPLNLNDPYLLANDGLEPSEGVPQFHQQMVYAVAMKTIGHFEKALGRPAFWATAPFRDRSGNWQPEPFIRRLRVYPHALRMSNAYYSPVKRALLFGYFPTPGSKGEPTGATVFTCLSYDIIAHETTHALLDGMYRRYTDGTNPDVLAFHEAFSDIVALFQHFTHTDVLTPIVEETRGDLETESLLGKLARQFGQATGKRGALRDAIGETGPDGNWRRRQPDPHLLFQDEYRTSVHRRGSILVAAVFDAFLKIYKRRTKPIIRLATGGSGILPPGAISADLAVALAEEAAKTAGHVLNICIRALDYLPPLDITFGEYLRAIITADRDLVPEDDLGYRIAFAESFRAWGIHPDRVTTVTPESLCWYGPEEASAKFALPLETREELNRLLTNWQVTRDREALHMGTVRAKGKLNRLLRQQENTSLGQEIGIDLSKSFEVHSLRPATSIGPHDELNAMVVVTLTQKRRSDVIDFRTGSTILFNLRNGRIRYVIHKRHRSKDSAERIAEYQAFRLNAAARRDPYAMETQRDEPFAALHLTGHL